MLLSRIYVGTIVARTMKRQRQTFDRDLYDTLRDPSQQISYRQYQ